MSDVSVENIVQDKLMVQKNRNAQTNSHQGLNIKSGFNIPVLFSNICTYIHEGPWLHHSTDRD